MPGEPLERDLSEQSGEKSAADVFTGMRGAQRQLGPMRANRRDFAVSLLGSHSLYPKALHLNNGLLAVAKIFVAAAAQKKKDRDR